MVGALLTFLGIGSAFLALFSLRTVPEDSSFPRARLPNTRSLRSVNASSEHAKPKWSYLYPPAAGSCRCELTSWGDFDTKEECLESFALESGVCTDGKMGVELEDCQFVVSIDQSYSNKQCFELCQSGDQNWAIFFQNCLLEKYSVISGGAVLVSNVCFSNDIHGHSDEYPTHLNGNNNPRFAYKSFVRTATASKCQEVCQNEPDCHSWFWRRSASVDDSNQVLHEPFRCFLKTQKMIESADNVSIPLRTLFSGKVELVDDSLWKLCNVIEMQSKYSRTTHSGGDSGEVCDCGCTWKSPKHVSGPRHCASSYEGTKVSLSGV